MAEAEWQRGKLLPKKQIRRFLLAFDYKSRGEIGWIFLIMLFSFGYIFFMFFDHEYKNTAAKIALTVFTVLFGLTGLIIAVYSGNKYKKRIKSCDFQWRQAKVQWFHTPRNICGDRSYAVADGEKLNPIDSPDDHIIYDIGERIIIVRFDKTDQMYCIRAVRREEPDDQ